MSVKTRPITLDEFKIIIKFMREGFDYVEFDKRSNTEKKRYFKPNPSVAFALELEASLGLRIGDILELTLDNFIQDPRTNSYKLYIQEQKTRKIKNIAISPEVYQMIRLYTIENNIGFRDKIFDMTVRNVQARLKIVTRELSRRSPSQDFNNISTHSFRKLYVMSILEENNYNYEIARTLMNHSNVAVTQKYIGVASETIEAASLKHNLLYDCIK